MCLHKGCTRSPPRPDVETHDGDLTRPAAFIEIDTEGSSAHRRERVVGAELLHRGGAHDGTTEAAPAARTARNEARGSLRANSTVSGSTLDRLDVAKEVVGEGILAELVERMLRHDLPLDGELTA